MLRAASVVVLAMLAVVAPANAAPPSVTISASATAGAAPLTVTFEARGDAASYGWQLGNGQTAEGPTASATYGPGLWTVTVTATAAPVVRMNWRRFREGMPQMSASESSPSSGFSLLPARFTSDGNFTHMREISVRGELRSVTGQMKCARRAPR